MRDLDTYPLNVLELQSIVESGTQAEICKEQSPDAVLYYLAREQISWGRVSAVCLMVTVAQTCLIMFLLLAFLSK